MRARRVPICAAAATKEGWDARESGKAPVCCVSVRGAPHFLCLNREQVRARRDICIIVTLSGRPKAPAKKAD